MGKRSRTGCITCRIRRVKCDETKPQCTKCVSSGRTCDGYVPDQNFVPRRQLAAAVQNLSTIGPASKAFSLYPPTALSLSRSPSPFRQDSDLFDVFRYHTAPSTHSFLPSDFWGERLLQLAHNEPAIWHATVAVGALHRRLELEAEQPGDRHNVDTLTRRAEAHHGKAMALAKDLDTAPKLLGLALTLMASSNLLGRLDESLVHILAGLRTARELGGEGDPEVSTLTRMLVRMDMQAMTFSDSQSPYPFADALRLQSPDDATELRQHIQGYQQAASDLFVLLKRSMLLDEAFAMDDLTGTNYLKKLGTFMQDIHDWEASVSRFEAQLPREHITQTPALSVRLYHTLLRLVMKATMLGPETRWDSGLAHHVRMITLAQALAQKRGGNGKPWLSLELGLVVPLFFTAHRCRHHVIRRRAVALLQQLNCQEGMWSSTAAVTAVKLIISVEEGHDELDFDETMPPVASSYLNQSSEAQLNAELDAALAVPWEAWSTDNLELRGQETWATMRPVPEENRVKEILIASHFGKRSADLKLLMGSADPNVPFGEVKDMIVRY